MPRFDSVRKSLLLTAVQRPGRYGASCAIAGAAAASIVWAIFLGMTSRSTTDTVSFSSAIVSPSIDGQPRQPASPAIAVDESIEDLLFAVGRDSSDGILGTRVSDTLHDATFCPLHERDDYQVEPPDILQLQILADGPLGEASFESTCEKYLVDPDGAIELPGGLGHVSVGGKTLHEIKADLERRLAEVVREPRVCVSVFAQNSHVYYVIPQTIDGADCIYRMPVIGNETVLDAITRVKEPGDVQTKSVFIARPQADRASGDLILPVNWQEVITDPSTATNYQVQSGDRIFIAENRFAAVEAALDQCVLPFRLLLGLAAPTTDECCCDGEQLCPDCDR
jgi:protein involved in polysaccharide export with SLBB domain